MARTSNGKILRGQGAAEYIVILAAVLVVGLGVMSILFSSTNFASGAARQESEAYWQSATPIAVSEASQFSSGDGKTIVLTLENRAPKYVVAYDLNLSSQSGSSVNSSYLYFIPGQRIRTSMSAPDSCTGNSGKTVQYGFSLFYDEEPIYRKHQVGDKQLVVLCS